MTDTTPVNLLDYDRGGLRTWFETVGERSFRADQIMKWVYQRGVFEFGEMTDLSKTLRDTLGENAALRLPKIVRDQIAEDGTRKWLLEMADGNAIETVFIPESDRGTLCVSSQVGCALNCSFCATARQGYNRNLTTAEIIGQVVVAASCLETPDGRTRAISNVVMMGMGEPLLNFDNVIPAMRLMMDDFGFGLSRRRVTLSTAGVVPKIDLLREECPVALAVSLHAPDDDLRNELVPLNKKYPIEQLLDACRRYTELAARERITFEYVMLAGVNDSLSHARELSRILKGIPSKVNLIPFNPFEGIGYTRSDTDTINRFRDVLFDHGHMTITRRTRGDDIDAACGQLAGKITDRTKRSARMSQAVAAP